MRNGPTIVVSVWLLMVMMMMRMRGVGITQWIHDVRLRLVLRVRGGLDWLNDGHMVWLFCLVAGHLICSQRHGDGRRYFDQTDEIGVVGLGRRRRWFVG